MVAPAQEIRRSPDRTLDSPGCGVPLWKSIALLPRPNPHTMGRKEPSVGPRSSYFRREVSTSPTVLGLLAALLLPLSSGHASQERPLTAPDSLASLVEILRTAYGVPHILAEDLGAAGYGLAWVMAEDYREDVFRQILLANGRWGLAMGRDSIGGDFAGRMAHDFAASTFHLLPPDVQAVLDGFARGMNDFARAYRDDLPGWVPDDYTAYDVAARDVQVWDEGAARRFARNREQATEGEDGVGSWGGGMDTGLPPGDRTSGRELASRMAWATREGEPDPEAGSNAWAFAPSRTTSGKAILLRNPHLSWTAGYYEAHVRVPGVLDFYGDFRLGGPFTTIGGFNRRLGWATTNNAPDLEEVYALLKDPTYPNAYRFDGVIVRIETRRVTVEFLDGDSLGTETREFRFTPLGPVLYETEDTLFVLKSSELNQYRLGEEWLRMMQATDLESWMAALAIRAKPSSNFTYADADGNILLFWNASIPLLPHPPSGDSAVVATSSAQVWTELYPFDQLPHHLNPEGGYVQNANDPPYYSNLFEPLDPDRYPENFEKPVLRFRSQNSLELVHNDRVLSLEDVVALKHAKKMILADRVKDDLVAAVRARHDEGEVREAIDLVAGWDNTVGKESRGSTLFELWSQRYFATTDTAAQFREGWSRDDPARTPRGVGSPESAVAAFEWAVTETGDRWGGWDVAWGEVHRVRAEGIDLPVGGCSSSLGCFRRLDYRRDEDGRYRVNNGDAWILAVEFGETPRAYSVLAYGNSNQPGSPRYYDQAEMFAEERMKPVAFTDEEIVRDLVARYRPGVERSR